VAPWRSTPNTGSRESFSGYLRTTVNTTASVVVTAIMIPTPARANPRGRCASLATSRCAAGTELAAVLGAFVVVSVTRRS
jgi:hypothetical protein